MTKSIDIRGILTCKTCGHELMTSPFTEPERPPMHMVEAFLVTPEQVGYVKQKVCDAIYYSYLCMNVGCDCDKPIPDYEGLKV